MGLPRTDHRPPLTRYVLSNWKMYPTVDESRSLLEAIQRGLRQREDPGKPLPRVIVCPPFVALAPLRALADARLVGLGAQNCHWEREGPYTGEVSPRMLEGLVEYVMVGHSDRRAEGERDDRIARKVAAVAQSGLVPILFVGEDVPGGDALGQTEERLRAGLSRIDLGAQPVLVVYEPAWAIGADRAATAAHVGRAVERLKAVLVELGSRAPAVLYGGTVNEANVDELAELEVVDGVGATRAGLDPQTLLRLVDRVARR